MDLPVPPPSMATPPSPAAGRPSGPARARTGPLTWAQQGWLSGLPADGASSFEDNMSRELRIAPVDFGRVRTAVLAVLERHEMLRSRVAQYSSPDPQIVDEPEPGLEEVLEPIPLSRWDRMFEAARCTCFRLASQWPVRILAGEAAGRVSRLAVVVDHWAADGIGMRVLADDLTAALAAAAEDSVWDPRDAAQQPVDLARWESCTPEGARQLARSLEYWRRQLERLGPGLGAYRPPPAAHRPDRPARFPGLGLSSTRLLEAATAAARRTGEPTSSVFLAAFSTAIGVAEQVGVVGTLMLSANRFSPAARRSVRNAIMHVPVVLPVPQGGALSDSLVHAAAAQQLSGHRFANAEPRLTERVAADVLGGLRFSAAAQAKFNYLSDVALWGDRPPAPGAGAPEDVVEPLPVRTQAAAYMLTVRERPGSVAMSLRWREDTSWQQFAEPLLRYIVDLICHLAAPDGAAPTFVA